MILEFFFNGIESENLMKVKSVLINLILIFNGTESGNLIKIKMILKKFLPNIFPIRFTIFQSMLLGCVILMISIAFILSPVLNIMLLFA